MVLYTTGFYIEQALKKLSEKKSKKSSVPYRMGDMRGMAVGSDGEIKIKFN